MDLLWGDTHWPRSCPERGGWLWKCVPSPTRYHYPPVDHSVVTQDTDYDVNRWITMSLSPPRSGAEAGQWHAKPPGSCADVRKPPAGHQFWRPRHVRRLRTLLRLLRSVCGLRWGEIKLGHPQKAGYELYQVSSRRENKRGFKHNRWFVSSLTSVCPSFRYSSLNAKLQDKALAGWKERWDKFVSENSF